MTHYIYTHSTGLHEVIKASMEKPVLGDQYIFASYKSRKLNYEQHVLAAPRLPVVGDIPPHWKEGMELLEGKDFVEGMDSYFNGTTERTFFIAAIPIHPIADTEGRIVEKKYPIGGFAPGNYWCKCCDCKTKFMGDKRAVQCEPCAEKMLAYVKEPSPAPQETEDELWREFFKLWKTGGIGYDELKRHFTIHRKPTNP